MGCSTTGCKGKYAAGGLCKRCYQRQYMRTYLRSYRVKRKYGLTKSGWQQLVQKQRGRCAICRKKPEKRLHVDHCHRTKKVRGLLCQQCNIGVGFFRDSPSLLRSAIKYLGKAA